jgi:hypothetical protein
VVSPGLSKAVHVRMRSHRIRHVAAAKPPSECPAFEHLILQDAGVTTDLSLGPLKVVQVRTRLHRMRHVPAAKPSGD